MRLDVARPGSAGEHRGAPGSGGRRDTPSSMRRRAGILSAARLAGMRLTHGWQLLAAVALGILVAVVLICTVPLYNTLISDIQLQRAINSDVPFTRNVEALVHSDAVAPATHSGGDARVSALAHQYLAPFTQSTPTYYVASDAMPLISAGSQTFNLASPGAPQVVAQGFDFSSAASHMRFAAGGPPQSASESAIQVIVTTEMASDLKLAVGSPVTFSQFGSHTPQITAQVAGVWGPKDVNDPYWNGLSFSAGPGPKIYPIQLSIESFYAALPPLRSVGMTQHWIYYTQPETITTGNMDSVMQRLGDFRAHLSGDLLTVPGVASITVDTRLDQTIQDVESQAALLALPLYVIVAQVVGLALLFVVAMAGLLIDGQAAEIATLKSRGASATQLLIAFVVQGTLVALLALLAGPLLAAGLALALLHAFVPPDVLASSGLSGSVGARYVAAAATPRAVVGPALVGALLGIGAVGLAAGQSARLDVLAFRRERGRAGRVPLWRRLYLDLALAGLCVVGYVELGQFGTVGTRATLGAAGVLGAGSASASASAAASPLLLVTPALLLLAGALLVLRLFPLGASVGARLAARGRGATALLALAQVERQPGRYGRLTLLLVLAVGLGLFALTFDASLQRNAADRAAYTAGADVRVQTYVPMGPGADATEQQRLLELPGVLRVMPAYRSQASTPPIEGNQQVDLLGIDPTRFDQVSGQVAWRSDYASQPLDALMAGMRAHVRGTSAGGSNTPIWALVSSVFASQLHLKVGDRFALEPGEEVFTTTQFVVGGIVDEFPTLYPAHLTGSFVVVDAYDYLANVAASATTGENSVFGPNEYWLRTTSSSTQHAQILAGLTKGELDIKSVMSLSEATLAAESNPVSSGMRGLLLVGALTAAILAVLGSIAQSALASRQRASQFAVLRTLGMATRQLMGLVLGEQVVVYAFGLVGGAILGLLLVTATLPFLQFSDTTIDPAKLGIPPYVVTFNGPGIGLFCLILLLAFAIALGIAARYAATIGLGNTLRLGED